METSVFVVSDVHLGGDEGFRMCERGQARLAELFDWIRDQVSPERRSRIVIAGDFVDFLAEEPYEAFTCDEELALCKFERILEASHTVWAALERAAERCWLTIMLGNHDLELSLPKLRQRLLGRIGRPVEFLCGNEAFTYRSLLVEHGNRYDPWNIVDHDALRRFRSGLSRGETGAAFPSQPGSELVVRVMNRFKQRYPWVDLLKPETAATVPILAALGGCTAKMAAQATMAAAGALGRAVQVGGSGPSLDSRFVGSEVGERNGFDKLLDAFDVIDANSLESASVGDPRMVGAGAVTLSEEVLFRGLRQWGEKDGISYHVDHEHRNYLNAATRLVDTGHKNVIVFGHTHHAKRIDLGGGASYLNTGTWADLIRVPEDIFSGDESRARAAFGDFMVWLKTDATDLRRLLPTFARVDFDYADNLMVADVLLFDEGARTVSISTKEMLRRVQ